MVRTENDVHISDVDGFILPRVLTLKIDGVEDVLQEDIHGYCEHDRKLGSTRPEKTREQGEG